MSVLRIDSFKWFTNACTLLLCVNHALYPLDSWILNSEIVNDSKWLPYAFILTAFQVSSRLQIRASKAALVTVIVVSCSSYCLSMLESNSKMWLYLSYAIIAGCMNSWLTSISTADHTTGKTNVWLSWKSECLIGVVVKCAIVGLVTSSHIIRLDRQTLGYMFQINQIYGPLLSMLNFKAFPHLILLVDRRDHVWRLEWNSGSVSGHKDELMINLVMSELIVLVVTESMLMLVGFIGRRFQVVRLG